VGFVAGELETFGSLSYREFGLGRRRSVVVQKRGRFIGDALGLSTPLEKNCEEPRSPHAWMKGYYRKTPLSLLAHQLRPSLTQWYQFWILDFWILDWRLSPVARSQWWRCRGWGNRFSASGTRIGYEPGL